MPSKGRTGFLQHPAAPRQKVPETIILPFRFLLFHPARVDALVLATIMAPQLDDAQRILIRTLLTEGFETSLIASEASYTVRAVQRIRRE